MSLYTVHVTIYSTCHYIQYMSLYTVHVPIYSTCHYIQYMSLYTVHVTIYSTCHYILYMSLYTVHVTIYSTCHYIQYMSLYTVHVPIYSTCHYIQYMSLIVTSLNCKYSPVRTCTRKVFVLSKSLDSSDKTCKKHKQKTITCMFILCEPIFGTLHNYAQCTFNKYMYIYS